ncbi:GDSL-type esterase/lipase family protein [Mesobacillus subterraneus]|uniref:GDSL-type esterase/lipase family protein n=1 Tax=Mesobacillus subterraneus TaxID=285983 RepID=UPI00203CD0B6|nr:GDSL-type esterase/lipase family protein [Mesobacillus subterraneus]MCM3575181.1 GDSL-type esterase/lipase family protein [Mesobacillus subterraneus]
MRIIKILLLSSLLAVLSFSAWIYYPQYQINKIKQENAPTVENTNKLTYIDYYKTIPGSTINHLALGDSIIRGYNIPEEENFVSQFSSQLSVETGKQVISNNVGVIGITSDRLNQYVQDGLYDEAIKEADLITVNVGGNDILKLVKKSDIYSALKSFDSLQTDFSQNLAEITTKIGELNPSATIVLLELYNPMPADHQFYSLADKLLPKWNLMIYEAAKGTGSSIVVQTTNVINSDNLEYLSSDGVHPNYSGNTAISSQILQQFQQQNKADAVLANRQN